jgi:hypothetical protein
MVQQMQALMHVAMQGAGNSFAQALASVFGPGSEEARMASALTQELLDSKHPWIRIAKEAIKAINDHVASDRTPQGLKTFLIQLLNQRRFSTEVGMQELYAAFEPDQRPFWDAATKWLPLERALVVHNQRVGLQGLGLPQHRAAAERIMPAVHLLKQPLLPWGTMEISDQAAMYQTQLIESTAQAATVVRQSMPGGLPAVLPGVTGGAFVSAPTTVVINAPPSPFQEETKHHASSHLGGAATAGAPFAPIVIAPDGTQAADLGALNDYLTDLERRIAYGLAHDGCRAKVEELLKRVTAKPYVPAVMNHQPAWKKRNPRGGEAETAEKKNEKNPPSGNF